MGLYPKPPLLVNATAQGSSNRRLQPQSTPSITEAEQHHHHPPHQSHHQTLHFPPFSGQSNPFPYATNEAIRQSLKPAKPNCPTDSNRVPIKGLKFPRLSYKSVLVASNKPFCKNLAALLAFVASYHTRGQAWWRFSRAFIGLTWRGRRKKTPSTLVPSAPC